MTVYFEEEGALTLPVNAKEIAEEVVEGALDYIGCPYEAEVNLLLTMNEQIHEMKRQVILIFLKTVRKLLIRKAESLFLEILSYQRKKFSHRLKNTDILPVENMLF